MRSLSALLFACAVVLPPVWFAWDAGRSKPAAPSGPLMPAAVAEWPLQRPACPDQWVAQRGALERWRVVCVLASSEGSRVR